MSANIDGSRTTLDRSEVAAHTSVQQVDAAWCGSGHTFESRRSMLLRFVHTVFGALSYGFVSLWVKDPKTYPKHIFVKTCVHISITDPEEIARKALLHDGEGKSMYFGCGVRMHDLGPYKRGGAADVLAVPGLWLDLDIAGPGHQAENLPPDVPTALSLLAGLPPPSITIHSGGGLQLWWLFSTGPVGLDHPRGAIWRLLKDMQGVVIANGRARGFHVDDTCDLARVLRLPGTTNHKLPRNPRPVVVLDDNGPRYTMQELRTVIPPQTTAKGTNLASTKLVTNTKTTRNDVTKVTTPPSGPAIGRSAVITRLKALKKPASRALVVPLLEGQPYAVRGERDQVRWRLCCIVAAVAPYDDPVDLAEIFRPSLVVMAAEPGAEPASNYTEIKLRDTATKVRRAQERLASPAFTVETKTPRQSEPDGRTPTTCQLIAALRGRVTVDDVLTFAGRGVTPTSCPFCSTISTTAGRNASCFITEADGWQWRCTSTSLEDKKEGDVLELLQRLLGCSIVEALEVAVKIVQIRDSKVGS